MPERLSRHGESLQGAKADIRGKDMIDKKTMEIKQDEEKTVYKDLRDIGDDLPDHSPRFVLLSYPLTLVRLFPPSPKECDWLTLDTALRPIISTLRDAVLPAPDLQRRIENAICGSKGADEEYGRGGEGARD